ncbi:MAG: AI-2E family transporter YdiK [Povalibacter sp.]
MKDEGTSDLVRVMLLVLFTGLLLVGSFWTLLPFLGALIWATTLVISTWPVLLWVQRQTGNRRSLAVVFMTLLIVLAFVVPLLLAIYTLIDAANSSPAVLRDFMARGLSAPPSWIANIPAVGPQISAKWQTLSEGGPQALIEYLRPQALSLASWIIAATGGIGMLLVQLLLIMFLVAILYARGEIAARGILMFAYRLGGTRGEDTVKLAAKAVRSVALGVIVTSVVQSSLAGFGLWIAGIPHAGVLTAIMFVLGIAQLGPLPILGPAVAWLYWTGSGAMGTVLLIWSLPVIAMDNVLRPILIRKGVELPMLLIIAGVIGGLVGFGVMGLFMGPVLLAATYTLTKAWTTGQSSTHEGPVVVPVEPAAAEPLRQKVRI